jgi:hypothetical protein
MVTHRAMLSFALKTVPLVFPGRGSSVANEAVPLSLASRDDVTCWTNAG